MAESQLRVLLVLITGTQRSVYTRLLIGTHMQFRAARSLCTNFLWAKYSIPLATCRPKPIRSLTVGFCEREQRHTMKQQRGECVCGEGGGGVEVCVCVFP